MASEDVRRLLRAGGAAAGVALRPDQVERLERYVDVLLLWRRRMPLVSQRRPEEIIAKHVRDSLAVVPLVSPGIRVVDLGSGAGFPGLVLGIACPQANITLVESQRRKASFLREAVRESGVENVGVAESRAEDLGRAPSHSAAYELAVSRAVWPTAEFLALARPFLRSGGQAVAMKTAAEPTTAAALVGYGDRRVEPYELEAGERRVLVVFQAS